MAQFVDDGNARYVAGQDAYNAPDHIRPDAYAKGINVSTRRGVLGPRAPYHHLDLTFDDQDILTRFHYTRPIRDVFGAGKFQAAIPYSRGNEEYFLVVVSGLVFRLNIRTMSVSLVSDTVKVNQFRARVNWSLAGKYVVIFDFPDSPLIYDGDTLHRASSTHTINGQPFPEVPVSVLGAYNNNRLFVANAGNSFTAGDPTGSLGAPEAPVTFAEIFNPSSAFLGQSFSLGTENTDQSITAMGFLQVVDESTGLGPLFVATENAVYTYRTDLPRTDWENTRFGSILLFNAGIIGPRAVVNVNSDLIFLSAQGKVHALSTARNDARRWGNVPISREVENWLIYNDESLKPLAVLGYFDNRIYITANPYRVDALTTDNERVTDYAHGGFVVLILDNVATLQQDQVPVWEGLWTGLRPMDIQTMGNRCFIFSKDQTTVNRVYELGKEPGPDTFGGKERRIHSLVYTREYEFENPFTEKTAQSASLNIEGVTGKLDLSLESRASHTETFTPWGEFCHFAPFEQCEIPTAFNGYAAHNFKELTFGAPPNRECDPVTGDSLQSFRKMQYRVSIKGRSWQMHEFRARAVDAPQNPRMNACSKNFQPVPVIKQCDPDWILSTDDGCDDGDCNN